jgi:ubiquinol oxidase
MKVALRMYRPQRSRSAIGKLADDASLRDVVMVRDDEAHHRDVNRSFASTLSGAPPSERPIAAYLPHDNRLLSV